MLTHLFKWWIMPPSAQRVLQNYICTRQDAVSCMQMKQGVLINTLFLPTKWSVNYCSISGTKHLNKYLIMLERNICMLDKKNPSQFLVNANGLYSAINEGGVAVCRASGATYHWGSHQHIAFNTSVWHVCWHGNMRTTTTGNLKSRMFGRKKEKP